MTPNATNDLTTNDSKHNTILTTTTQQSKESTNDNNGVAIDNKIEQAMDLVKSHVIFQLIYYLLLIFYTNIFVFNYS